MEHCRANTRRATAYRRHLCPQHRHHHRPRRLCRPRTLSTTVKHIHRSSVQILVRTAQILLISNWCYRLCHQVSRMDHRTDPII